MKKVLQPPEGWLSLLLLAGMITIVTRALQHAGWPLSLQVALQILFPAAMVGLLLGFLLARVSWISRGWAHLISLLVGSAWVIYLATFLRSVRTSPLAVPVPYLSPALHGWKDVATELLIRIIILGRTFARGESGEDIVLFIMTLAALAWMLGYFSSWFAFRSHWPWVAIGMTAVSLMLDLFYGPSVSTIYFTVYVFLALVFLVYYLWRRREAEWQKQQVRYPQDLSRSVLWAGVLLSGILILATAFFPTTAASSQAASFWDRFLQPWKEVRGAWERLFSDVGGEGTLVEPGRLTGYESMFSLGGARTSPAGIAFEVRTGRNDYLRGIAFDHYDGRGWRNTAESSATAQFGPDNPLRVPSYDRIRVLQTITPYLQGGNMIFAESEPITSTLPGIATLGAPLNTSGFADTVTLRSRRELAEGRSYTVMSLVSIVDKTSLRNAGQNYPDWLRYRYLQLPPSLPQRVSELADQIVAEFFQAHTDMQLTTDGQVSVPAPNGQTIVMQVSGGRIVRLEQAGSLVSSGLVSPYDAAEAIQNYLRSHMTYNEKIPNPPARGDLVDYFVFESRTGYCDYFASAMAVMVRTQGIPSRMIRGYAAGTWDAKKGVYVVPASLAHAWTEVYFPNYGWLRFEPTAASYTSLPNRPENADPGPTRGPRPNDQPEPDESHWPQLDEGMPLDLGPNTLSHSFPWAVVLVPTGLLALAGLAVGSLNLWAGRGLGKLSPVARTYERMCRWAGLVRLLPKEEATPFEIAGQIAEGLPQQQANVATIAGQYVRERFSPHKSYPDEVIEVHKAWDGMRWPLWAQLRRRFGLFKKASKPEEVQ